MPNWPLLTDLFATEVTATAHAPVAMEAARRVCGDEARLIYVSNPQPALAGLGEWVPRWKVFTYCPRSCVFGMRIAMQSTIETERPREILLGLHLDADQFADLVKAASSTG